MILYYTFDREMLNAIGFLDRNKQSQRILETIIENELKMLVFFMPLNERIVISPSFRFESLVCRKVLEQNREFVEQGVIAEYRREADVRDFWLKKNETYQSAMNISNAYYNAYGQESIFKVVSPMWIDRVPKKKAVGLTSRDAFMVNIRKRGERFGIPIERTEDVLKITDETKEITFLWEVEEYMLHKYGISDSIIRDLGIRESMNQSYLDAFAEQNIQICRSCLGIVDFERVNPMYDMWQIKAILERLGVYNIISILSAKTILNIRKNFELQNMLDIIRNSLANKASDSEILKVHMDLGDMGKLISKLILQPIGGNAMNNIDKKSLDNEILKKGTRKILHLSDLHFTDQKTMEDHYFFLKIDLQKNFKIFNIDYLIISGDVSDRPDESMYKVAVLFVQFLSKEFHIPVEHIILIPGNHDCDRTISKEAYDARKEKIIDQKKYNSRYIGYSKYFYEPIKGRAYPMNPEEQFEDYIFKEDGFCVLGLNSCWEIDHKYTERSSICMRAIQKSKFIWASDEDYIKLAVWHHPLSGWASIQDTTFMETLANLGFKVCFHGHIHEARNELFTYDVSRNIRMIGAGTFGAVQKERGDGIPRQYNMVEFDKESRLLIVHTRKREKDEGMWQADARWGDKNNNPKSTYTVQL